VPDNNYANMRAEISPNFLLEGIRLGELRKIREVVEATPGPSRAEAILAAMRGRLIKSLVIDTAGAQAILDMSTCGNVDVYS
jgi:DNA-binding transcriptional regulator LsrR (DeoR family)